MNQLDTIKCPVCLHMYDSDKRIPKISPTCGHTICKECLVQVLDLYSPKCPLDKLTFSGDFQTIDAFPTNFLGKDLLEIEGRWSRCSHHQEPNKMICLADNTLICANCVIFGNHKGHEVRLLSDFKDIVQPKKEQLQAISAKISKTATELIINIEEKKQNIKSFIQAKFQNLRLEIAKQEAEALMYFENIFINEKNRLQNILSKSLDSSFDVKSKLEEFDSIMSNPNITMIIEEDFSDLVRTTDEKLSIMKTKHTEEFSKLLSVFQQVLPKDDLFKDFDVVQPLNQQLNEYIKNTFEGETFQITQVNLPETDLTIYEDESENGNVRILYINNNYRTSSSVFERHQLEKINKLHCGFSSNDIVTDEKALASISLLSKFLRNIKAVEIDLIPHTTSEEPWGQFLSQLLPIIFSNLENLEEIGLNVSDCKIRDNSLLYLFEELLPRFKNLKAFSLVLNATETTTDLLFRALINANLSGYQNLEKLHVSVNGMVLNEASVIEFLHSISDLKDLSIAFHENQITDKAIESFSTQVLPSLKKLQAFEMDLSNTKITNIGFQKLLANIPNIRKVSILLEDNNQITDAAVQEFVNIKLPLLTRLREFHFDDTCTGISTEMSTKIEQWAERLETLEENGDQDGENHELLDSVMNSPQNELIPRQSRSRSHERSPRRRPHRSQSRSRSHRRSDSSQSRSRSRSKSETRRSRQRYNRTQSRSRSRS